jgi:hypothetical protein
MVQTWRRRAFFIETSIAPLSKQHYALAVRGTRCCRGNVGLHLSSQALCEFAQRAALNARYSLFV